MIATCQCDKCGELWHCAGNDEPDVNAFVLTGDMQICPECDSDDFTIIATE